MFSSYESTQINDPWHEVLVRERGLLAPISLQSKKSHVQRGHCGSTISHSLAKLYWTPLLEEKKAVSVSTIRAVRILRTLLMYSYSSRILSISGMVSAEVENISSPGLGSCIFPLSKSLSILEISIGLVQYVTYQPQTSIDILFTRHENIRLSIKTQHLFIASFLHSNI